MTPRRYDIVEVADIRFPGGTSAALCRELDALAAAGLSVALLPVETAAFSEGQRPHPGLTDRIEAGTIAVVGAGEEVACGLLVAHNPVIFDDPLPQRWRTAADARLLVVHQAPVGGDGRLLYDPLAVERNLTGAFGGPWLWAPTGPAGRGNLAGCGSSLRMTDRDWPLVVDAAAWGRPRAGCRGPVPVAGRHSRPDRLKWPADPADLGRAFPPAADLQVRLMGFEGAIAGEVGTMPPNWEVLPFGAEPPPRFLESIDFFVYHPHPAIFETFGLTVAEAMASGAVAILAPVLRTTFGDAALYAEPADVYPLIRRLAGDPAAYAERSAAGWRWVEAHLSPERLADTAGRFLTDTAGPDGIAQSSVPATPAGERLRRQHGRRRWLRRGAAVVRRLPGGDALVRQVRGRG